MKKETSGDHQRAILAFLRCIQSRPNFFAEQLNKAIKVRLIDLYEKIFISLN